MTLPPPGQDDGGEGFEVEERLRMGGDGTQCVGALQHWGCIRYSASCDCWSCLVRRDDGLDEGLEEVASLSMHIVETSVVQDHGSC